jgi:transposase-like protein
MIQRCQVHKKRNVKAHVPEKRLPELDQRLGAAYQKNDYEARWCAWVCREQCGAPWRRPIPLSLHSASHGGLLLE